MKKEEKLVVGKMGDDESILSIRIDSDTNSWVMMKYNGEVFHEDKSRFQKGAIVFWDSLKVDGWHILKHNKSPALKFIFKDGMIQLKDGVLIAKNVPPSAYEMFYYIVEEYKKRAKK